MCNDAIRIAIERRSRRAGSTHQGSVPTAEGVWSPHPLHPLGLRGGVRRISQQGPQVEPICEADFLKITSQSYRLDHLILRIPTTPRHYIYLTLQASDYHLSLIDDPTLKRGSVTITEQTVNLTFSKEVTVSEPLGSIGIDVNERNVTTSDTLGRDERPRHFTGGRDKGEVSDRSGRRSARRRSRIEGSARSCTPSTARERRTHAFRSSTASRKRSCSAQKRTVSASSWRS